WRRCARPGPSLCGRLAAVCRNPEPRVLEQPSLAIGCVHEREEPPRLVVLVQVERFTDELQAIGGLDHCGLDLPVSGPNADHVLLPPEATGFDTRWLANSYG